MLQEERSCLQRDLKAAVKKHKARKLANEPPLEIPLTNFSTGSQTGALPSFPTPPTGFLWIMDPLSGRDPGARRSFAQLGVAGPSDVEFHNTFSTRSPRPTTTYGYESGTNIWPGSERPYEAGLEIPTIPPTAPSVPGKCRRFQIHYESSVRAHLGPFQLFVLHRWDVLSHRASPSQHLR